jgi:histone H3/H4
MYLSPKLLSFHNITATENWKAQALPLARIKKIMKIEEGILHEMERERNAQDSNGSENVNKQARFMIAGEAPVLLGKACELLIKELSARAWRHTERNRRRTLQRQDVHAAVGESEVFDFLIDIVPRLTASTAAPPPPPTGPFTEHAVPPLPHPVSIPVANITTSQTDAGMRDGGMTYTIVHPIQEHQVPVGYEQYYMQMHQAQLQAENTSAPSQPQIQQNSYIAHDPMGLWCTTQPQNSQQQQFHNNSQS